MAKVLIIDDEEDVRVMIARTCNIAGVEVVQAESGLNIERVVDSEVIVAFLDWAGDSQGLECARFLYEWFPKIRVYIFSGNDRSVIVRNLYSECVSVAGVVDKTASMEEIELLVRSALYAKKAEGATA